MRQNFRLAGVMGWPIAHSRSPKIHNHWLAQYGLEGYYAPLAIAPDKLAVALRALGALGFAGCNLTIPHKEKALTLVDRVEDEARRIGAINCVVVEADGSLTGKNYDAFGFTASLRAATKRWRAESGPAAVIGAGGGARAVVAGLIDAGVPEIRVFNRTLERAQALVADLGAPSAAYPWSERARGLEGVELIVNTTSLGMIGQPALDLALDAAPPGAVAADIVYAPLKTPFLSAAQKRGLTTVDGLGMLLHQARPAFRDWFGVMPEVTPALRDLIAATIE